MALKAHLRAPLNVQHESVPVVAGCLDRLPPGFLGQVAEGAMVEVVQPRQPLPDLGGVNAPALHAQDVIALPGQEGSLREVTYVSVGGNRLDILLPAAGEQVRYIESYPPKT